MVSNLEWDSNFFGLHIGKTIVSSQEEMNALLSRKSELQKDYNLIYIFAQEGLVACNNVTLVDKKVVYSEVIKPDNSSVDSSIIDYPYDYVSDDLLNLALASGIYSRFNIDKNFPFNSYRKLYTCWIEQSVKHVIASKVFCYMIDDIPRGLLTIKTKGHEGIIGLVATDNDYRGRGIGKSLLHCAKRFCYEEGIKVLSVATQYQNNNACHFYERVGFTKQSCTDIWHWWL